MSNLFASQERKEAAPTDRPTARVVRELEAFGYKAEAVRTWTREKANTALASCRREEAVALRRAEATAKQQGEEFPRGQPSIIERLEAAACVEQALGGGIDELCQTLMYTLYVLSDGELKRLANYLVRLYRGEQARGEAA